MRDIKTSLAILNEYENAGIKQVWLTPHIMEDVPNTTEHLKHEFDALKTAYNGSVTLRLASENMIDSLFYERLKSNDFLPIGDRHDMLLVETTMFIAPYDFEDTLQAIMSEGYYPLLAHPERYIYIQSIKDYERIKTIGVRFQLNLLSLVGMYGKTVQQKAQDLLKHGMYEYFGSDLHRYEQVELLTNLKLSPSIIKALDNIKDQQALSGLS